MTLTVCKTAGESVQLADHPFAQGGEAAVHAVHAATVTASTVAKTVLRSNAPVVVAIPVVNVAN